MRLPRAILAIACASLGSAPAVMFYDTGNLTHNTTTPGIVDGLNASQPWNLQGQFGNFLGTPISANHFITAKHIGQPSTTITFSGGANAGNYTIVGAPADSPNNDFRIWTISGMFLDFAPLYTTNDEVGKNLLVIGRGTQRGANYIGPDSAVRGWNWGVEDNVQRWGRNSVSGTFSGGNYLLSTFTPTSGVDEGMLSVGDSGGAVFIQSAGIWRLAGINFAVSGPFYSNNGTSGSGTRSAIYNESGLYSSGNNATFSGPLGLGSGVFVASRVSTDQAWIASVIPEPSTYAMLIVAGGCVALGFRRRFRRSDR